MRDQGDALSEWAKKEFQFDDDDLRANRKGEMSEKQKSKAVRSGTSLFYLAIFGGIFCYILLATDWIIPYHQYSPSHSGPDSLSGILVLLLMGAFAWMGWRSRKAGKSGIVESTTGKVRFEQRIKDLFLCIGEDIEIEVDEKGIDLFSSESEYRVYHSEEDKTILSIEQLEPS